MKRIRNYIKLIDYGDFYKWEINKPTCRTTTEGFRSITRGLKILKRELLLERKPSQNTGKVQK